MILPSLISQLEQRFQHEKRASVCLWFDEKKEFARLLPALEAELAGKKQPPFTLLRYDAEPFHGQIWLKHQVHSRFAAATMAERAWLRFVIYLPLSEDRLDAGERDDIRLDLLEEYRAAGVLFKIGGKRPTLFSFLKQAGLSLTENLSEQRRLYEGGQDSLLAKYVAKFVDRPATFWTTTLTPDVAQARLIGDLDQSLFELAADPVEAWASLQERALDRELLDSVRERYGFEAPVDDPAEWLRGLVSMVAITETFIGYGEPAGFPLAERLPAVPLRAHHVTLVQRWLRDAKYRDVWDRRVHEVEADINLGPWAEDKNGRSVAFPHLILQRWQRTWSEFEASAAKESSTEAFFEKRRTLITEQSEFMEATNTELGKWTLLADLDRFVARCAKGREGVANCETAKDLAALYAENARHIEGAHLEIRHTADEAGLGAVERVADRAYAGYTNALNDAFFKLLASAGSLDVIGLPNVTTHLEKTLWKAKGRRAVIIVDALRYDCAVAIGDRLRGQNVDVTPILAMLPTITPIGMTAMLPLSGSTVALEIKGNSVHPQVDGKDTASRQNRLAFLTAFGAECRDISEVESSSDGAHLGELLVVFGHEEVDHIGHGQAETLIRHIQLEIERLARLIRKLHRWGYEHVHIVTDHGFILLNEEKLPSEVPCEKDWCKVFKERFALVSATADLPVVRFPFAWDASLRVAVPPGLAFFKAEKSFSHGGAAVQELVIPHLVSRGKPTKGGRVGIEVVVPAFELQHPIAKVTLRAAPSQAQPPQMGLFTESGRTLAVDVLRRAVDGTVKSVLGKPKEVRIDAKEKEQSVTLFFHTAASFQKGETLELDIRDVETTEQFPPGGIKLSVGRDM